MIGIFDSGFGGLTILKEIKKLMPKYDYIYLGDSARTPYGNRSPELLYDFSCQALDYFFLQKCDIVIFACFTVSTQALRKIQTEYLPSKYSDKKVLGVARPLVEEAIISSRYGKIGVVGTRATIESDAFVRELEKENELQKKHKKLDIYQNSCPLLVPLIEEGWTKKRETKMILKKYLNPLKIKKVDTLILGCTHYPILYKDFKRIMGKNCAVFDTGKIVAESFKNYLERHPEIEKKLTRKEKLEFLCTDNAQKFNALGNGYFGAPIKAKKVVI